MAPSTIALIGFAVLLVVLLGFAAIVLFRILTGTISLDGLIAENDLSKASLARFQFLIFTFLIAGLFLLLSIESGGFVPIPETVLGLLGISGGSFVISKAVSSQENQKKVDAETERQKAALQAGQGQPVG